MKFQLRFKSLFLFVTLLLGALCSAESGTIKFLYNGAEVGENKWERSDDGTFTSHTKVDIATQHVLSDFKGKLTGAVLNSMDLNENTGANKVLVHFASGKVTISVDGKNVLTDKTYTPSTNYIFHPFHPILMQSAARDIDAIRGKSKLKLLNLQSVTETEFDLKVSKKGPFTGLPKVFDVLGFTTSGITIDFFVSPEKSIVGIEVAQQKFAGIAPGYEPIVASPLSKFTELSQPTFTFNLTKASVPTESGLRLATNVWTPTTPGTYPCILIRTPYGNEAQALEAQMYASRGYVVVSQDVRGTGDSDGTFDPFMNDIADAKSTLDWICAQSWSNQKVGMIGGSYLGYVQWAAAVTHHPALKCIIPQVSPPDPMHNIPYENGCFSLMPNVWWSRIMQNKKADLTFASKGIDNAKLFNTMPLSQVDNKIIGKDIPFYNKWLKRTNMDSWKGAIRLDQIGGVKIPVMHVSGTWDGDGIGTKLHWEEQRKAGGNQWLIFGPWVHAFNTTSKLGNTDYGPTAILELDSVFLRFFDTYLKDMSVKQQDQPRVRMFVTGANKWLNTSDWPAPGSTMQTWYLGGGKALGSKSQGELVTTPPSGSDPYSYDPEKLALKKSKFGIEDSNLDIPLKDFSQELIYKSQPMLENKVLAGPLTATLYVSSTAKDAMFFALLAELDSKGIVHIIGQPGVTRMGFDGNKINKTVPNKVYKITVKPWEFAHEFKKGSRAILILGSNQFPRMARIPGTGESDATATKFVKATNTIYKNKKYLSNITLQTFSMPKN